ncbi:thermonuclease family protein [Bradyrhizobium ontarionense]|uniref:Thermonuclease family protein n=1 Tax=Bradyrhizobium ontarionense TaxID=2898149 RepID=A0ABY3RI06_9BRAD|nr:thermonuclease family protein [Bradyrhizobium sp. A19]UFZ07040.1 thermonuclease family protein [Bradyrhizobium sp. A19]
MRISTTISRTLMVIAVVSGATSPATAASAVVRSGDTIQLGDSVFRLDGIDAPEVDQLCIDDHADSWNCGVEAREQLTRLIGGRSVRCDDLGPDKPLKTRRIGICTVDGDKMSLNQQVARAGFAVSADPAAKYRGKDDIAAARETLSGLWKGCFVAPGEFRTDKKDGVLLGASCRADRDREIRAALFPDAPAMPPGCSIKGKFAVRARVTGNIGIYHLQGCPSYPATTEPDRWFCSEDDARAAGFRRAFNCRAPKGK